MGGVTDAQAVTRRLLACGLLAGPLFTGLVVLQDLLRPDHDLRHDAVSTLALGPCGWVQVATFALTGALTVAFAVGARRAGGGRLVPVLVGALGVGLVGTGLFVIDPAGEPRTWVGVLHDVASGLAVNGGLAVCAVEAWRAVRGRRWRWAAGAGGTALAGAALGWPRDPATVGLRQTALAVLLAAFVAALAVRLRRRLRWTGSVLL